MSYPLISEYLEAIKSAENNFEELTHLRPVLGEDGQPVMTSGNFAVVFKMKDEQTGKPYAVKCFTKEQEGRAEAYHQITAELKDVDSPYLVSLRYLEKELFVDTEQTDETEFPVLLMDWVEGKTLDKYLRENLDDKYALEMLAYRFSQLAQWLIPQPFAHGDLKPDNILVREDGTLVLVDYDGMYVPAMKGQKARELGSPDFRHPLRTENNFDEHIDDFPFVSILLSLKVISLNPQLLDEYGASDRLLFGQDDYIEINRCILLNELSPSFDGEVNQLTRLFFSFFDKYFNHYFNVSINLSDITLKIPSQILNKVTSITYEEWKNRLTFEFEWKGVADYSRNGKKLLRFSDTSYYDEFTSQYEIKKGTEAICDKAFADCHNLRFLKIPNTIKYIGENVFEKTFFRYIELPKINYIARNTFDACPLLRSIIIPKGTLYFFQSLLPTNKSKIFEIDRNSYLKKIESHLSKLPYNDSLTLLKETMSNLSNLYRNYGGKVSFYVHRYENGEGIIHVDDKQAFWWADYNIVDLGNLNELTDAIYHIILDLNLIKEYEDYIDSCNYTNSNTQINNLPF
jgi:serine/threonine protein kinase